MSQRKSSALTSKIYQGLEGNPFDSRLLEILKGRVCVHVCVCVFRTNSEPTYSTDSNPQHTHPEGSREQALASSFWGGCPAAFLLHLLTSQVLWGLHCKVLLGRCSLEDIVPTFVFLHGTSLKGHLRLGVPEERKQSWGL